MFGFRTRRHPAAPTAIAQALEGSFSEHEIDAISQLGTVVNLDSGSLLTTEGQLGLEALVIVSGTAAVSRGDEVIATLSAGDVVGEGALLLGEPRNASVIATTDVKALVFNPREFTSLLHRCPRLAQVTQNLASERQPV